MVTDRYLLRTFWNINRHWSPLSPPLYAEKVANAKPHTGIVHCFVGSWDAGTGTAPGFAYSSAVLPSTFPAAYPPWNSVRTRWCGYALTSDRATEEERAGGGVGDSRVFLVPIHNCKFPSPYLCSPVLIPSPDSACRFANTGLSTSNSSGSDSEDKVWKCIFLQWPWREFPSLWSKNFDKYWMNKNVNGKERTYRERKYTGFTIM